MAKKRLKKGEGRIQELANRDRISALAAQGYGPVGIYEILSKEGLISMSYGGFYEAYHYGEVRKKRRKSGTKSSQGLSTVQRSAPLPQKPPVQSGVRLAELDEAIAQATAKRGNLRKKSGDDRKDVIG